MEGSQSENLNKMSENAGAESNEQIAQVQSSLATGQELFPIKHGTRVKTIKLQ